ncbi:unnamed protein product [Spirodela intermedia]|uniref:Uncharacterized protein n=1 Tax=Spirodela intermedia TaxID=51605 RepID=A0A7I8IKC9_SPIIN|nr:unnamed protein product [Spirodela intermedia]CAA6657437.1 unnamed protein product [Spirodela intermedia]
MAAEVPSSPYDAGFDEPEEFPPVNDSDVGVPAEQRGKLFDLMRSGNRAFREGRIEEAIACYSKAQLIKPGDPVILSNRSAALCRISRLLRSRPSRDSEYEPLNGLDPTTHAELALKDAEKVMSSRKNSAKSYSLKANALLLLERYGEAREVLISGLHVNPLCQALQKTLQELDNFSSSLGKNTKHGKPERNDDFECTVCFKLLYEPVTTPCGHSFCRSCLHQSMDHGNKCPMCRTVLFTSPRTYPCDSEKYHTKKFPEEYAERRAEHENLTNFGIDLMPLFVMDIVLPFQKLSLNIFEPRYRLMVRRVMEGNRRMGMVGIDSSTGLIADFACEVEISECEPLPDGRFYLEVEGRRRFHILRSWDQDGYRVAEVEWIQDIYPHEGTSEREFLEQTVRQAAEQARGLIVTANEATMGRRLRRGLFQAGPMPSPQDPERFSFWLANLSAMRPAEKLDLLRLRDTQQRISRALTFLGAEGQGCVIQ